MFEAPSNKQEQNATSANTAETFAESEITPEVEALAEKTKSMEAQTDNYIGILNDRAEQGVSAARRLELEAQVDGLLDKDISEKYEAEISAVKESKMSWVQSEAFANRLKSRGASEEEVAEARSWVIGNLNNAKVFILEAADYNDTTKLFGELSGNPFVSEARGVHVDGDTTEVPLRARNAIFIKENASRAPVINLPGQPKVELSSTGKNIDLNILNHELGHAAEDGLLHSELYKDWKPKFLPKAPDPEYVGMINETDTRIRAVFRALDGVYDPTQEEFKQEHLDKLRKLVLSGKVRNGDLNDLFNHYPDDEIVRLANYLPAI